MPENKIVESVNLGFFVFFFFVTQWTSNPLKTEMMRPVKTTSGFHHFSSNTHIIEVVPETNYCLNLSDVMNFFSIFSDPIATPTAPTCGAHKKALHDCGTLGLVAVYLSYT